MQRMLQERSQADGKSAAPQRRHDPASRSGPDEPPGCRDPGPPAGRFPGGAILRFRGSRGERPLRGRARLMTSIDQERARSRTLSIALGVVVLGVALLVSPWKFPEGSDGGAMFATAESLLTDGTLAID